MHDQDTITFKCTDGPETGDARLTSGYLGRIDVFQSGIWEPVPDSSSSWTLENSNVVCRELGYNG